ncbi:MAG: choice-of-anchor D domain-containing protein [Sedimentisphaerales bacterium]|nr:choice-of-anchor D domain-containing protein [Sedimentisphaerales bacterium]
MSHKVRRRFSRLALRSKSRILPKADLKLEPLEQRLLLDVSGWWDELGFRSGSGGGITWDPIDVAGESQLVLSSDGDPIAVWVEGTFIEYNEDPIPFHWEIDGDIYVRQYAGSTDPAYQGLPGWWDLSDGSADGLNNVDTGEGEGDDEDGYVEPVHTGSVNRIGTGRQIAAAAGPNGEVAVVWVTNGSSDPEELNYTGGDSEIYGRIWDGSEWVQMDWSETYGGISNDAVLNEKPSVVISPVGEVFVSYTAIHPGTDQREIVVKRYGYNYPETFVGVPHPDDRVWVELTDETIGEFAERPHSGVSHDEATSFDSSIVVDLEGRPIVAWSSMLGQDQAEIYVKRWTGDTWIEINNSNSASDPDDDGRSGVSNDSGMSLQPDLAITDSGDLIVTWVNWADWANYDNPLTDGGQAGIFVRELADGSSTWTTFDTQHVGQDSATNRGLAPSLGWYYTPKIDVDSAGNPVVSWQGFGAGERYVADRDGDTIVDGVEVHTPDLPGNQDLESPVMAIYAGAYNGTAFGLLTTNARNSISPTVDMCWMPDTLIGENDEILVSYTWRDSQFDPSNLDYEVFVQEWDTTNLQWTEHGRGSNSNGNDVIGPTLRDWRSTGYSVDENETQIGLVDYNDNPEDPDVMLASPNKAVNNGGHIYHYSRVDDTWYTGDVDISFGYTFDLEGEPDIEFNLDANPLLAYLDDVSGLPYVYEWIPNATTTGGTWTLVGGGPASGTVGNTEFNDVDGDGTNGNRNIGISVQAGPYSQILLTYLTHTNTSAEGVTNGNPNNKIGGHYGGGSDDLVTLLWDGNTWSNVGDGFLKKQPGMGVAYYSDFDGFDFTEDNIAEAKDENDDGDINIDDYEESYDTLFYGKNSDQVEISIEEGNADATSPEPGAGYTGNPGDAGMVIQFNIPSQENSADWPFDAWPGNDEWPGGQPDPLPPNWAINLNSPPRPFMGMAIGYVDYFVNLDSWVDDLTFQFSYAAQTLFYVETALFVMVDRQFIDMDTTTAMVIDPVFLLNNPFQTEIEYNEDTQVTVDLSAQMAAMRANLDLDPGFWSGPGEHTISLVAVANPLLFPTGEEGGIPVPADEEMPKVYLDNFVVYQRLEGETGYYSGVTPTYPRVDSVVAANFDANKNGWESSHDGYINGNIYTYRDATGGFTGATGDGGLVIRLGNGTDIENNLLGTHSYEFTPALAGLYTLDLDYSLLLGTDVPNGQSITLQYRIDGGGWNPIDTLTKPPAGAAYQPAATIPLGALTAATHKLEISAELSQSAEGLAVDDDFEGANPLPGPVWDYRPEYLGRTSLATGVWNDAANDTLRITLGDDTTHALLLEAAFECNFTAGATSDFSVSFDYALTNGNGLGTEALSYMIVSIIDNSTKVQTFLDGMALEYAAEGPSATRSGTVTIDISNVLGDLPAGVSYTLLFHGGLTETLDTANSTATVDIDNVKIFEQDRGRGYAYLDNIVLTALGGGGIEIKSTADWRIKADPEQGHDSATVGYNDQVGPEYDQTEHKRLFDFGECMTLSVTGNGAGSTVMDTLKIDNVYSDEDGPMVISFRYRLQTSSSDPIFNPADPANTNLAVRIDGTLYDAVSANQFVSTPTPAFGQWYSFTGDSGWWNGDENNPEYTYVYVVANDIEAGPHTVHVELNVANEPTTVTSQLWIDNLAVIVSRPTNAADPKAILLPNRNFAVGVTNKSLDQSLDMPLYGDDDADPHPDDFLTFFDYGLIDFDSYYYTASVWEQNPGANKWQIYGDNLGFTQEIDFLGFSLKENLQSGSIGDVVGLGFYTYGMPAPELYKLSDLCIGPNGVVWAGLQHAESEWVDVNGDGELDAFHAHPWNINIRPYWGPNTDLDIEVWRWQPYNDPLNVKKDADQWVNTNLVPNAVWNAYTNLQMVSSGGQLPSVAWTLRGDLGSYADAGAQRYQEDKTWGVMNTESIQNNGEMAMWSALWVDDMIVRPDGFPIASFYMGHLDANGIREFNTFGTMPDLTITEQSGIPNDDLLDFGSTSGNLVDRAFSINNIGGGDLTVYSIEIGGTGSLPTCPFSLRDDLNFPFTLTGNALTGQGGSVSVAVRFDPEGIPDGDYSAVLIVHTNDPRHPDHPFSHFYDVILRATSQNDAEMTVSPRQLVFPDTVMNTVSTTRDTVVRNRGDEDLTISEWFFAGVNFSVDSAYITDGDVVTPVANINNKGSLDDIVLVPNAYLTFSIEFAPQRVDDIIDTFYIHSDDQNLEYAPVALFGTGISGASMEVTENVGTPNNDTIEFGSVIQDHQETQSFTITNTGSTDLTIISITDINNVSAITMMPYVENLVLAPTESIVIDVTFSPEGPEPGHIAVPEELDTILRILNDDPIEALRSYEVSLTGLSVPEIPIISIEEVAATNDASDNMVLDFVNTNINATVSRQLHITNLGGADLTLDSFVLSNTIDFSVEPVNLRNNAADDIVLPYDSAAQTVTVTFNPTHAGYYDETLRIYYYNENNELVSQTLTMQALALNASLQITDSQGAAGDQLINFGPVSQGLQSTTETVTLTNNGTSALSITNWALTTGDTDIFQVQAFAAAPIVVAPGASTSFDVLFSPEQAQAYGGQITITSDDPNNPTMTVDLLGQGSAPGLVSVLDQSGAVVVAVDFTPVTPLVFGIGQSVTQSFTVRNITDVDLLLKGLTTESSLFILNHPLNPNNANDDIVLPVGGEFAFTITFDAANMFDGSVDLIMVTNNAENTGTDVTSTVTLEAETVYAPRVGGAGSSITLPWIDEHGNTVTFIMFGGGSAVIIPETPNSTGGAIDTIQFIGTTSSSFFMARTTGSLDVGSITGTAVGSLYLTNVNLVGDGIDIQGLTSYLSMGNLENGADINIGNTFGRAPIIQLGNVGDGSDIDVNGDVLMFRPATFGNATFNADDVTILNLGGTTTDGSVNLTGNLNIATTSAANVNTDFIVQGNINFIAASRSNYTGAVRADNISFAMFRNLEGAAISASRRVGYVMSSTNLFDSLILGGYDLGNDGRLGGGDDVLVAGGQVGYVSAPGSIRDSFVAAGIAPTGADFFNPSATANGSIGSVRFGNALAGADAFGVAAHTNITSVLLGNKSMGSGQIHGDFEVHLI